MKTGLCRTILFSVPTVFVLAAFSRANADVATGGVVAEEVDAEGLKWRIHTFTNQNAVENFVVDFSVKVEWLIVAGGGSSGGGGSAAGSGGGGAGIGNGANYNGGLGGGGNSNQPGQPNRGGGGGGVYLNGVRPGRDGGSGVVIVRYLANRPGTLVMVL